MPSETKKITLGLVLSWIFGVLFGISGLTFLFTGYILAGGSLILASLILLPPVNRFMKIKWNLELSRGLKITLVIVLFIVYGVNSPSNDVNPDDVKIKPTGNVNSPLKTPTTQAVVDIQTETDIKTPQEQPKQKVKSATLSIDRIQIQLANLYPTRVTVTNTGDVTIYPKFDVYVYDNSGNEVCSGSPLIDEFSKINSGDKKTGEFTILGCMFEEDGTYNLKIDLLDSDYNKLDTKSKNFDIDYWNKFDLTTQSATPTTTETQTEDDDTSFSDQLNELKESLEETNRINSKVDECTKVCAGDDYDVPYIKSQFYTTCYQMYYYGGEEELDNYIAECKG